MLLPCLGAAIGAASHPKPDSRFGSEATVAVRRDAPKTGAISGAQLQVGQYAAAVMVPEVIEAARVLAKSGRTSSEIARGMTVLVEPGPQLVRIRVRDTNEAAASALAAALATISVNYVRARTFLRRSGTHVLGAFEDPVGRPWGAVTSRFATPPRDTRTTLGSARFGVGKLRVTCPATSTCGAAVRIYGSFRAGIRYTAEGWIRSPRSHGAAQLVFGMAATNRAVTAAQGLTPTWRRIRVAWTPRRHAVWTDVVFRTTSSDRWPFELDGVRLLGQRRAVYVAPPASFVRTAVSIDNHGGVLRDALLGALAGLVVACAAIGLSHQARRRATDQPPTA